MKPDKHQRIKQTKMPRFMLEGLSMNYVINTSLLLSSSGGVQNYHCVLRTVMTKKENKNIQQETLRSFITIPLN